MLVKNIALKKRMRRVLLGWGLLTIKIIDKLLYEHNKQTFFKVEVSRMQNIVCSSIISHMKRIYYVLYKYININVQ